MISALSTLISLIIKYKTWGIVFILIVLVFSLVRILIDEDRSAAWRARFFKIAYKIFGKSTAEKKYIENDINSRINLARKNMPFGQEYLPKAMKIEWIEAGGGEAAYVKENEIIVRLDPSESQQKNIVLLADALIKQTSLIGIRYILNEPLEISLDLNLIKNLLKEIGDRRVMDWFFRNEYMPAIEKSEVMKKWNCKIIDIDERGLFTRLLLVELDNYSKRISGKTYSPEMLNEIVGLINFLYKIATKTYGQDTPLDYISRNIKIGVILVGETSKILYEGVEPYLRAFAYIMKRQLSSIYVIQFDKELLGVTDPQAYEMFIELTKRLNQKIEERFRIKKDFNLRYKFTDSSGSIRKARISHYIPEYIS